MNSFPLSLAVGLVLARVSGGAAEPTCTLPEYGFYFGDAASPDELDVAGDQVVKVQLRSKTPVLGFSLGIQRTGDKLTFEGTLGNLAIELVITREDGSEPAKGVQPFEPLVEIRRGVPGGRSVTIGHVTDVHGTGKAIPTAAEGDGGCGANEVLLVQIGIIEHFG